MNVAVWIASGALAALFLLAGAMKLVKSKSELGANPSMRWAEDFPPPLLKAIGAAEVAGALGLILPGALDIATWLVPTAAVGLAVMMIGAALTHARLKEFPNVALNVVLLAVAVFIAVERFGPHSF